MTDRRNRVCPVELAGSLDSRIRRWFQDPRKITGPYLREGMTVLDLGCGPGFFSIDMAYLVGKTGRVIAADLQEGMLQKLGNKIKGTELENRITLHKTGANNIGLTEQFDFVLLFYMVHEVPDKAALFREIGSVLKSNGQVLMVEPPFHVSKKAFEETIETAREAGLIAVERPKSFLDKVAILQNRGKS
jgi:ubiquinone/menaquinone biosynthesis C-methylase UbiE